MTIDWSQYAVKDNAPEVEDFTEVMIQGQPQSQQQQPSRQKENVWLGQYKAKEDRGYIEEGIRHTARTASRVGETIAGAPGDLVNFVKWLDSKMPEEPKWLKKEPNFVQRFGKKQLEKLPSSTELKQQMSEITGGFVDPQGAWEEFGDSVTELGTGLMFGKDPTKVKNIFGSIAKSVVAKSAKEGVKAYGGGEGAQFTAELGTLMLMGFLDKDMASKYISDKYKKAGNLIPENTMIDTSNLMGELESLEQELSKGIQTATKNEVKGTVSELKGKVSGGAYPADELVEVYHDINEKMSSKNLFSELSKSEQKKLKFRYKQLQEKVAKEISKYGKSNPEFLKEWREANQGFATIAESRKVTNFLESKVGKVPSKLAGSMALEVFLGHPEIAGATAASFTGLKTGEMLYRISKSPTLRKHYANVIKEASAENLGGTIKALNQLDAGLKKSFLEDKD